MSAASVYLSGTLPPCPEQFNAAAHCLHRGADDALALIADDPQSAGALRQWSFAELRDHVMRANGALREAGVSKGDRVVILLGDVPEFPIAYFGAIAAGAVATPLSSQLSQTETSCILEATDPFAVVAGPGVEVPSGFRRMTAADLATGPRAEFASTHANDPALLVFTSGSSGRPKGVLHAQRAFWARQSMRSGWHDIGPGDRVMHAGAFNWTFTLGVGLADTWRVGGTAILNAGERTPEAWPALARAHAPTIFAAAPAVYRRLLKYGSDLGAAFATLRHAVTAGEALSPDIARAWDAATEKPLLEALGMSEISTFVSTPPGTRPEPGIAGWPQPGREVAVLGTDGAPVPRGSVGILAVRRDDPGLALGYWRDVPATRAAHSGDWFLTGDLVTMREDGAIAYAGRQDDQMNAQGYRVDPGEVEAALTHVPGIADCGVTELPVENGLSVIAAWIVLTPGVVASKPDILAAASQDLATYKIPREVFLVDELPRSANGKLLRRKLHALPRNSA